MSDCPDCGAPNVATDGYVTHCGRMLPHGFSSMDWGWRKSTLRNQVCKEVGKERRLKVAPNGEPS